MGIDLSAKTVELVNLRLQRFMGGLFHHGYVTARIDILKCTDLGKLPPYQTHKPALTASKVGTAPDARSIS